MNVIKKIKFGNREQRFPDTLYTAGYDGFLAVNIYLDVFGILNVYAGAIGTEGRTRIETHSQAPIYLPCLTPVKKAKNTNFNTAIVWTIFTGLILFL